MQGAMLFSLVLVVLVVSPYPAWQPLCCFDLKQIALSKNYTKVEWQDDLRLILGAGTGQKPYVFLFSDTQVKYDSFVLDINSILNTGQVPNLFT